MENKQKKKIIPAVVTSVLTSPLIILFLSGKIIDIPHETQKGGIISVAGVAAIIVIITIAGYIVRLTINRFTKTNNF